MKFNCQVMASKYKIIKNWSSNTPLDWHMLLTFDMAFSDGSNDTCNAVYAVAPALNMMLL